MTAHRRALALSAAIVLTAACSGGEIITQTQSEGGTDASVSSGSGSTSGGSSGSGGAGSSGSSTSGGSSGGASGSSSGSSASGSSSGSSSGGEGGPGSSASGGSSSASAGGSGSSSSGSSSGSSGNDGGSASSSSGSSSGGDGGGPGCPLQASIYLGIHVVFNATWPATIVSNAGTGPIDLWFLGNAAASGTRFLTLNGAMKACGMTLPDVSLNAIGQAAGCAPGQTCGTKVEVEVPPGTFDAVARTFPFSGSQTGWNVGTSVSITPSVDLLGIAPTSTFAMDTTAWPSGSCTTNCDAGTFGPFAATDISDDDGDGEPGITALTAADPCAGGGACTYTYAPTSVTLFAVPPLADRVYIALRTELQFTDMRMNSCTSGSGTSRITLFDSHVLGCHIHNPASACTSAQANFLDQNRAIYGPNASTVVSPTNPITGTVTVQQLVPTATCADARAVN